MHASPLGPLITPPPPRTRQSKQTLLVIGCLAGGVMLGGLVMWRMGARPAVLRGEPVARPIPEVTVMGPPSATPADLRMVTSYNQLPLSKPEPTIPPAARPITPAVPLQTIASQPDTIPVQAPRATPVTTNGHRPPTAPPQPGQPVRPPPQGAALPGSQTRGADPAPQAGAQPTPWRWYTQAATSEGEIMQPPFKDDDAPQAVTPEGEKGPRGAVPTAAKAKESTLFPKAVWERPANPTRVIYSSQLLQAVLEQDLITGESSTVRMRLTETLYDKFGQQQVLLPMDTRILATAEGNVKYGQTRVPIQITKAELPDGTDLVLVGKAGDAGGSVGLPGRVDNRIKETVFAALLTAAASVGSRYAGGQPTGFQPSIEQDFARDASQSLNASGQKIIERSLNVQPVISVPVHTPVSVQLSQNISLQTRPVIIHK